jgi:D-alanyl-D-alanine carboxypeptidase
MERVTIPGQNVSPRRAYRARIRRAPFAETPMPAQHVRRRLLSIRSLFAIVASATLVVGGSVAVTAALTGPVLPELGGVVVTETPDALNPVDMTREQIEAQIVPMPADGLPTPSLGVQAAGGALCDDPAFIAALEGGTDADVIAAAGGADAFRAAVAVGGAPCVPLDDPARAWVVVNKVRPYTPVDFAPTDLVTPEGVRSMEESTLRADAAAALTSMVRAAADAGVGEIAQASAYRSFATQRATYSGHVADRGVEGADLVSARPGFSEHQSGLGVDVVPCDGPCATIDDLAGSSQGDWVAENAWQHGWIVRYEEGRTDVTGYAPEPWHLRYIGVELARAYHEGGWTTMEEFFGLPAAPAYAQ